MHIKRPTRNMHTSANEPPYEMNGNGSPVTGISPIVIAIFTVTWNKKIVAAPIVTSVTNGSSFVLHIDDARHKNNANNTRIVAHPTKPNCSPSTLKIKSVCPSGKKARFVCVPLPNPFPVRPPEPMAVMDCSTW